MFGNTIIGHPYFSISLENRCTVAPLYTIKIQAQKMHYNFLQAKSLQLVHVSGDAALSTPSSMETHHIANHEHPNMAHK